MCICRPLFAVVAVLASIAASPAVKANPIEFIYTGTASGTLGDAEFTDLEFVINAFADTDNRYNFLGLPDVYAIDHASATLTLAGFGSFSIITQTSTFSNTVSDSVGLLNTEVPADLIYPPFGGALTDWDMLTSVGPVSGEGSLLQWSFASLLTSGGVLQLVDGPAPITFQAIVDAGVVPEPATLALSGIAIAAICLVQFRRRAR